MILRTDHPPSTTRARTKVEVLRASLSDALRMTIVWGRLRLEGWVAGEFEIGETDAVDEDLVGTNGSGGFESSGSARSDVVVLIHAVAADAEAPDERAILEESHRARKEDDAAFVAVGRAGLIALRAGILHILQK